MSSRWRAAMGAGIWLALVAWQRPSVFEGEWAVALLLFAALVLAPLALDLAASSQSDLDRISLWRVIRSLQLPAALLLTAAFLVPPGVVAATLAVPWAGVTALVALAGGLRAWQRRFVPAADLCVDAGLVYFVVGGGWTLLDRASARPLHFSPVIVLLTAVHFHYAGLLLPLLTGLALRARSSSGVVDRAAAGAVMSGVPLVAMGITATQLGYGSFLETVAVWVTAGGGLLCAWLHGRLAADRAEPRIVRGLWLVTAVALAIAMPLALLYGMREHWPSAALDIPWMRAMHGTVNALGFGLAGLAAWTSRCRKP